MRQSLQSCQFVLRSKQEEAGGTVSYYAAHSSLGRDALVALEQEKEGL